MPEKLFKINNLQKKDFSLILSGGSSLGLAHIGIIKFLEEQKLQPSEIIGTSMGSVVGALYAIGNTSETISEKLKGLKARDLFEIKYFQGRIEYKKAKDILKEIFRNKKISETKIPLKIIATNIKNGEKKVFTKNDNILIYDAILASIAIPGVLTAKRIKGEIYIDGCVSSNLPIEVAKGNNIKLAINVLNRKVKNYHYHNPKKGLISNLKTKFAILKSVSRYYLENQTEAKLNTVKKLILIEPDLKGFNSHKLINYKKIIEAGYFEIKKYFDKAKKIPKRKEEKKKKRTSLKRLITFPITETKKIFKDIQKLK
ncbi:patatin-like phospholipase family protein [archaeon]|nr:patatin-like phospholipase family protein [archaeon]